jgi:tRNA-guanine family transglycosylase
LTLVSSGFARFSQILSHAGHSIWLGQSVDTSVIHTSYEDFESVPILTSLGCVMRRPNANSAKFDGNLRSRVGAGARLMVDSGGFVLMTKRNRTWNGTRVAQLYERIQADYLVSLDEPPRSTDHRPARQRKYERTLRNLEYLFKRFGPRIVPVVHGTDLRELEINCQKVSRVVSTPSMIGIGGLVPVLQRSGAARAARNGPQNDIASAVRFVTTFFPKSAVHVFGVGSLHTVLAVVAVGARSVDSIGWRQAAGFGSVYIPGRHRRLLTQRERPNPCRPFANDEELEILRQCACPPCRQSAQSTGNIHGLAQHFKPRAAHNIWVLYSEVAAYLIERQAGRGRQFLASRLSEAWMRAIDP